MEDHYSAPPTRALTHSHIAELLNDYSRASTRLLLLDYDGSLVPFASHPSLAQPGSAVLKTLSLLAADPLNEVYIISGRDAHTLESWFNHVPIGLIAEHGALIREKGGRWTTTLQHTADWKPGIERIMHQAVASCAGSFIEQKQFSVAWHYRNADEASGVAVAKDLLTELTAAAKQSGLSILPGNKVIEVRVSGIDKGMATARVLQSKSYDFILAIGDDRTDEDMFSRLLQQPQAYTIKVGAGPSQARYYLSASEQVVALLNAIGRQEVI